MIYKFPESVIRKVAKEIKDFSLNLEVVKALETEIAILRKQGRGVAGLAAPQIGLPYRVFIAQDVAYINPLFRPRASEHWAQAPEGCFSVEGSYHVRRYTEIPLTYTDVTGKVRNKVFRGWDARVIQHEMDHLDGKTINVVGMPVSQGPDTILEDLEPIREVLGARFIAD